MLNRDKYAQEIVSITLKGGHIAIIDDKPVMCDGIDCGNCIREDGNWECDEDRRILQAWANSEYKEKVLTKEEKDYLSAVIKPFKDKVQYIAKYSYASEWITIKIIDDSKLNFPFFERGTMYKGMKEDKEYTLKELGL